MSMLHQLSQPDKIPVNYNVYCNSQNLARLNEIPNANTLVFPGNPTVYKFISEELYFRERIYAARGNVVEHYVHLPSYKDIAIKFLRIPQETNYKEDNKEQQYLWLTREIESHRSFVDIPHIVQFYGFCILGDQLLICMELMDISLRDLYASVENLPIELSEEVIGRTAVAVTNAINNCKSKEVIHRDIKPSNILLDRVRRSKMDNFFS